MIARRLIKQETEHRRQETGEKQKTGVRIQKPEEKKISESGSPPYSPDF
jgi:hypothetical protein